jgi:uncharacterized SAM-binding protein YcdF (DUF218 family)
LPVKSHQGGGRATARPYIVSLLTDYSISNQHFVVSTKAYGGVTGVTQRGGGGAPPFDADKVDMVNKRRQRWAGRLWKLVLVGGVIWLWQMVYTWMAIDAYGRTDRAQQADVIIVLGAGLRRDNTPGPALRRRAAQGAELWRQGIAPVILCSGGKPGNRTRSEADACRELLEAAGVPATAILLEETSRSTEENALESGRLMAAQGWQTAVIVSDQYHLYRAQHIFSDSGLTVYASGAALSPPPGEYLVSTLRELVALNWYVVKSALGLPITYVQGI